MLEFNSDLGLESNVRVVDLSGKEVLSFSQNIQVGANAITVDLNSVETGFYFVEVVGEAGVITRQQLIKE